MILSIALLFVGFALLIKGAAWLVDGAIGLARRYDTPELAIGLTIVAFGTSLPELVVNVYAAYTRHDDVVVGNIIGSNNFNLFIILGIAGIVSPIVARSRTVWKEVPLSALAAGVFLLLANDFFLGPGHQPWVSRWDAVALLLIFAGFLWYVYRSLKHKSDAGEVVGVRMGVRRIAVLMLSGLVALFAGGQLVLNNAVALATGLGISEKLIGLTIVAAGTSLPELATSIAAALKRNTDIALGNVVGSNIFNVLFVLAVSALVHPIAYNTSFNSEAVLLLFGTALLFLFMFIGKQRVLQPYQAMALLLVFVSYAICVYWGW